MNLWLKLWALIVAAASLRAVRRRVRCSGGDGYVVPMTVEDSSRAIGEGRAALARGAWGEARARFTEALTERATPDAYEGLGIAARYELDREAAIKAHEQGYRLARSVRDRPTAARLAIQLAYDAYAFRGMAEASGWVERAALLVDGESPSVAAASVPMLRAHLALLADHDPELARAESERAMAVAREVGAVDVEMFALALNGLSLVSAGEIEVGMRRIDAAAAAALGGEMTDADSIESVCRFAIDACKRVRDLERANEWCLRVRDIAVRFGDRQMFAICRTHYADVLLWHGDWTQAEHELTDAVKELRAIGPDGRSTRWRAWQSCADGRDGSTSQRKLLARVTSHRFHPLVEGLLALDGGDVETALEAAARFLRRIGEADRFERVTGLELLVRAAVAGGDARAAGAAAGELGAIAAATPTAPLRAAALLASGRVAAARGEACAGLLEDAADLFDAAGARYDAALARLELATALRAAGRVSPAFRAEAWARDVLRELGARMPEQRVGELSPRETEVLQLVARGLSNEDIARELVLSVRTVERHVANIYAKIGASGRTARAVATAWAHGHNIA